MSNLNQKVNIKNGVVMFIVMVLTTFFATPELVKWVGNQPWAEGLVPILAFFLGLLTRFYKNDTSLADENPSDENKED